MLQHIKLSWRSWLVIAGCTAFVACGGDDGPSAVEADAGTYCNPATGGIGTCYCMPSGTAGVKRCNASTEQWGACMCNEPPPPVVCPPGARQQCTCPDGVLSERICRAANTVDPCMCDGHLLDSGMSDASESDGGSLDAG
jgi:hypothetical protein